MKKAALHNLGCKVNAYETEAMRQMLEQAGYEIVPFDAFADVYIVNTCTVTNIADRKSRQMLHRARRQNQKAVIVGVGCYVQAQKQAGLTDETIDIVIGNNRKHELVRLLEEYEHSGTHLQSILDINHEKCGYEDLSLDKTAEHTRAFLKVQDGCNQFCSYCIIPFARGRVRSRALKDVWEEAVRMAKNGYREIVLTGIHLSSYGLDTGDTLLHLMEEIHKIEGIERIRLGSLEPRIITEGFVRRLAKLDKVCPHFHISLQSGCDTVLTRMNRRYNTEEYEAGVALLRRYFSHPAITTDVIVGFPGETDEEFDITKQYLERIHFYEMHVFKYSKREGTRAAGMPDQIPETVKALRSSRLIALGREMSEEFREAYIGKTVTVLLEEPFLFEGKSYFAGYTKEYVKAAYETRENLSNQFVTGKILRRLTGEIYLLVEF